MHEPVEATQRWCADFSFSRARLAKKIVTSNLKTLLQIYFTQTVISVYLTQNGSCLLLCVYWRPGQTARDVILVWMMCLYQSSVLADGLLNPSDTMCVCMCVKERHKRQLELQSQTVE